MYEFDIKDEVLRCKPMPRNNAHFDDQPLRYFGEFRGQLHLIYVSSPSAKMFHVVERDANVGC